MKSGAKGSTQRSARWYALLLPLILSLLLVPAAVISVRAVGLEKNTAAQPLEDLVNIQFRNDIRVFTVMAAINMAGFDYEMPGKQMPSLRSFVRSQLRNIPEDLMSQLREFYSSHTMLDEVERQSSYVSLALLLEEPPDFRIQDSVPDVPEEVRIVMGFEKFLPAFYEATGVEQLWERVRPEYEKVLETYKPVLRDAVVDTLQYFRTPERIILDSQIILIPDLLNFSNVVNARNLERIYYIVPGPTLDVGSNFVQLQHEYLHFLVDPLVEKNGGVLLKRRSLLGLANRQPHLGSDFKDRFLLIVGESLIEAVLFRLHPPVDSDRKQVELYRRGLIFVPHFVRALEAYESSDGVAFPAYMSEVFEDLSESEIRRDSEEIARIEAGIRSDDEAKQAKAEAEARATKQAEDNRRLMIAAGVLLSEGKYAEAEEKLKALIASEPSNGNAYFYLGQAAAQQKRYEESLQYYCEAQAADHVEDWVKAWAGVRIGKIRAYQGKFEEARRQFEKVIEMKGEFRGARQEALESVAQLPEVRP